MKEVVQFPAIIEKVQTLVDRGNKLTITTQELNPQEMTILFSLKGLPGFLAFAEREVTMEELEIPEPGKEFTSDKSPSQRLRAVIYKYWEMNTDRAKDFDAYYREYVNKLVDQIKEKLN